jgi:hypothetical protein
MPGIARDDLAAMGIGERDWHLIALRMQMFGETTDCISACPSCGEQVEFSCHLPGFSGPLPETGGKTMTVTKKGYTIVSRLPSTADLMEVSALSAEEAYRQLFGKCILSATCRKKKVPPEKIPPEVRDAIIGRMEEEDAMAEIRIAIRCTACGHEWEEIFDIGSFLWTEIQAEAAGILMDVRDLARAYGWTERDILAMSPVRRSWYREMIG